MRGLILGVAAFAALCIGGCAKKEPSITRIEGSEPQRLSFGAPKDVQKAFLEKMKLCWLEAPGGLLAGARYEASPAVLNTGSGPIPLELITVYAPNGGGNETFNVEFHRFNDNTLIATRNRGFPPQLAAQLKRDVEGWVLERPGCGTQNPPEGASLPGGTLGDSSLKGQDAR